MRLNLIGDIFLNVCILFIYGPISESPCNMLLSPLMEGFLEHGISLLVCLFMLILLKILISFSMCYYFQKLIIFRSPDTRFYPTKVINKLKLWKHKDKCFSSYVFLFLVFFLGSMPGELFQSNEQTIRWMPAVHHRGVNKPHCPKMETTCSSVSSHNKFDIYFNKKEWIHI